MSRATVALLPGELAWIAMALRRYIIRSAKWLNEIDVTGDELESHLKTIGEEIAFLNALLAAKAVSADDRMGLVLSLRNERGLLQPMWATEVDVVAEINSINAFLKRLSGIDWEYMGVPDVPYDPCREYRSFRLSEAEVCAVVRTDSEIGSYAEDYETLVAGSVVTCTLDGDDVATSSKIMSIRIARICSCETRWDEGEPCGKMFEGDIIGEPSDRDGGDEAYGFLFPGGHAVIVNSSPDSDYTSRMIDVAMCLSRENA